MNGLGFSALLVGKLQRPRLPGVDEDWARTDAALLRLGVMLVFQLALCLGLTWLSR